MITLENKIRGSYANDTNDSFFHDIKTKSTEPKILKRQLYIMKFEKDAGDTVK